MKKTIILLTSCVLLFCCHVTKTPEFIGVDQIELMDVTSKHIIVNANVTFNNPNVVGGKLQTDEIKVLVNDMEMANISTSNFDVPKKKEFTIPLKAIIPTDSIFSSKSIAVFLGSLFGKEIKVQYKGAIKYKIFGISNTYPLDTTENIKIKL